jgi:hypothetical protein
MARRLYPDVDLDDADLDLLTIASEARNPSAHGYRLKPRQPLQTDLFDLAKTLARKAKSCDRRGPQIRRGGQAAHSVSQVPPC